MLNVSWQSISGQLRKSSVNKGEPQLSEDITLTYLVKVGVAPHFPISKHAGHDSALLVDVCPLTHGPTLKASQAPVEEV